MAVDILGRSLDGVDMCRWDGGDEELVLVVDACDKAGEATNAEVDEAAPMATAAAVAANDFMLIIIAVYFGSVACGGGGTIQLYKTIHCWRRWRRPAESDSDSLDSTPNLACLASNSLADASAFRSRRQSMQYVKH